MTIVGADSCVPQPSLYGGTDVWMIYVADHRTTPYVWTRADSAALGSAGVEGVMPVYVPVENTWPLPNGEFDMLFEDGETWGVCPGSPALLDIEQSLAQLAGAEIRDGAALPWIMGCEQRRLDPWLYLGRTAAGNMGVVPARLLLAGWPIPTPVNPSPPAGFSGWQYAGNQQGGRIDYDCFVDGCTFMKPDASGVITLPVVHPAPGPPKPPTPIPPTPVKETAMQIVKVTGAAGEYVVGVPANDAAKPWAIPIEDESDAHAWEALGAKPVMQATMSAQALQALAG
jgi:hypothetical protein